MAWSHQPLVIAAAYLVGAVLLAVALGRAFGNSFCALCGRRDLPLVTRIVDEPTGPEPVRYCVACARELDAGAAQRRSGR